MTEPTPEAVEAVAAAWDESCRTPRTYPGMIMACQQCIGCRVSIDALAFIRDAIHRDGPDADAIRAELRIPKIEWALLTDGEVFARFHNEAECRRAVGNPPLWFTDHDRLREFQIASRVVGEWQEAQP